MDCKDLMIGDWVVLKSNGVQPDTKIRITELSTDGGFVDDCDNFIGYEELDPIPLTEEILLKNGFVKTWNGDWQLKEYATIIISKDYYVKVFERSIRIDYVHELQHALHAACVEKEIEL